MGWRAALLVFAVTVLAGWGAHGLSYRHFVADEYTGADGRLSLYRSSLTAEFEQLAPLIHVLARDRAMIDAAAAGEVARIKPRLKIFPMTPGSTRSISSTPTGSPPQCPTTTCRSASSARITRSRPASGRRLRARGQFYAIGATTGLPGYFLSELVLSPGGDLLGVIALKISFESL